MPLRDVNSATFDRRISSPHARPDIADQDAFERALREREARLELLEREVDHRGNNLLATVLALARMTQAETVPDFIEAFTGRVAALSRVQSLLSASRWKGADLRKLAEEELAAYRSGGSDQVKISGPEVSLDAGVAQALAMIIHELATNAAKYGALACKAGALSITWHQSPAGDLLLRWTETGVPEFVQPSCKGFGTRLIEHSVTTQLRGTIAFEWMANGLTCDIAMPADRLSHRQYQ